jgi:hypothetical protein
MTLVEASPSLGRDAGDEAVWRRLVTVMVVAISRSLPGLAQHLGGYERIQYGRSAVQANRQHQATTGLVVLAVLLGSLWAGGLAASAAGDAADQLAASRALPGVEPAAPRDRVPALRPPVQRPAQSGRLVPLLLGLLAASLTAASGIPAGRRRSIRAPARSPVLSTPRRGPRAPPRLQPA